MDDYLILQICRVKLQEALDSGSKERMVESLKYALRMLPYSVAYSGVEETRVIVYSNGHWPVVIQLDKLDAVSAKWNVQGFISAIDKEFTYYQYKSYRISFERSLSVFERDVVWKGSDVLYEDEHRVLNVDGFLNVCGYAVKVGEAFNPDDELFDEASAVVSVFKGLELILGNRLKSSSVPKMLHLANDFLLRAVKPSLETKESKQLAVGVSLLVDLSIDFLSYRKRF